MMDALERLRGQIRQVDRQILSLVRERMDFVNQVGKLKRSRGIPLRDWQVERAVLDSGEEAASQLGLSSTFVRNFLQQLLEYSRSHQEREAYSNFGGVTEEILIIGGRGKMGRWFADFFQNQGHSVTIHDLSEAGTLDEALEGTSCAVICTPLEIVPDTVDRIARARYAGVAFDIASLKGHLKPAIDRARALGLSFTSVHPMFGPATRILSDQVVCICDCGDAVATQRARGFFAETAATLIDLSLEEHDRIASYVLGLSHVLNVLFVRVLMHGGRLAELNRVGSTTFHAQLSTSSRVMHENAELYFGIQHLNPFTSRLYAGVADEWRRLTDAVLGGDVSAFVELMNEGRAWLDAE